jgi:hypothetical protein
MGVDVKVKMEIAGVWRALPDLLWGFVCSRARIREHSAAQFTVQHIKNVSQHFLYVKLL